MSETYIALMKNWLFVKDNMTAKKLPIDGFGYTESILKSINKMTIGETVILQGYALKRIN